MINDNTILSSFDDRPTLLEWLKKVEDALKSDTATAVSVENPSANTYVFKITFADGTTLSSGNVVFPNAVQDVSIKNGHIIVTQISGMQEDLGSISSGTQWYEHNVNIANPTMPAMTVTIKLISTIKESLKDVQLPSGNYTAIMTYASGPSAPNADSAFPVVNFINESFTFKYLGTDGTLQRYNFTKSSINSDVVTAL